LRAVCRHRAGRFRLQAGLRNAHLAPPRDGHIEPHPAAPRIHGLAGARFALAEDARRLGRQRMLGHAVRSGGAPPSRPSSSVSVRWTLGIATNRGCGAARPSSGHLLVSRSGSTGAPVMIRPYGTCRRAHPPTAGRMQRYGDRRRGSADVVGDAQRVSSSICSGVAPSSRGDLRFGRDLAPASGLSSATRSGRMSCRAALGLATSPPRLPASSVRRAGRLSGNADRHRSAPFTKKCGNDACSLLFRFRLPDRPHPSARREAPPCPGDRQVGVGRRSPTLDACRYISRQALNERASAAQHGAKATCYCKCLALICQTDTAVRGFRVRLHICISQCHPRERPAPRGVPAARRCRSALCRLGLRAAVPPVPGRCRR